MAWLSSSATLRSSPGGLGLGVATSSRTRSIRAASRSASSRRTSRSSRATLDGGVSLLVAGAVCAFDPVARRPAHALPGFEPYRFDLEQPARLLHRRSQVCGPVLTQVAIAHTGRDRHPFAAHVGAFDQLCLALAQHLAERLGLLDHEVDAGVADQVLGPARALAGNHPEVAVPPLMPADRDVRVSIGVEAGEVHVDALLEELLDLIGGHSTDFPSPALLRPCHPGASLSERPVPAHYRHSGGSP